MERTPVDHASLPQRKPLALIAWFLVLVSIAFGYSSLVPPRAVTADAPATEFSADRAMRHVEAIAREPHPMGTAALDKVRRYIVGELEGLALDPEFQAISAPNYFGSGEPVDVVNVMATIPGLNSTGSIALMAHYDTVPATPGANDNSASVSTVLEVARSLINGPPMRNDVLLLFTDAEEPAPRYGSKAFVADSPLFEDVGFVVNLEAAGGSGPSMLAEGSGPTEWLVQRYAAEAPRPTAFSFISATTSLLGDFGTDFDPFRNAGVPGYHFAYMGGSPIYHLPADSIDAVGKDSLQHHGSNALAVARYFGNVDLTEISGTGGSVYFTLRPFFVQYPAVWSVVAALAAAGLFLFGTVRRARGDAPWWASARSGGKAMLLVSVATLAATLAWLAITAVRSAPSVVESYAYLAGVVGIGALAAAWLNRSGPGRRRVTGYGIVLVWVVLALFTAFIAPGFSALFAVPALAGAVAMNWDPGSRPGSMMTRFALVAVPTVVLLVPGVDFYFQMGQPRLGNPDSNIPYVAGVGFLLALLVVGLVWTVWTTPARPVGAPATHR